MATFFKKFFFAFALSKLMYYTNNIRSFSFRFAKLIFCLNCFLCTIFCKIEFLHFWSSLGQKTMMYKNRTPSSPDMGRNELPDALGDAHRSAKVSVDEIQVDESCDELALSVQGPPSSDQCTPGLNQLVHDPQKKFLEHVA